MAALGSLVIELGASLASLRADFERAQAITDRAVNDINVKIGTVGSTANFSGISGQVKSLTADFEMINKALVGVLGVGVGMGAVKQVAEMADEYQNVSNRIRTTTSDAQQLAQIQKEVFTIAQQTGTVYDDTGKMYQRLYQSIQSGGKAQADAQREALALTKTLNEEIIVSGASAGEASRSIMDLVHGLSGGVLHAQQLRPIMRQMPDLAKQIADGMGLSAKQFEEMVHQGLPAEAVLKALANQSVNIEQKFKDLPLTFARSWTMLDNAVMQYIGSAAQASAASNLAKDAIVGVANNIGTVVTAAEAAAVATGVWLGSKSLQAMSTMVMSVKDMALAQGEYKTAAMVSAEADLAGAAATQKAATANAEYALQLANKLAAEQKELVTRSESEMAAVNAARAELARATILADTEALFLAVDKAETKYNLTAAESAVLADKHSAALTRLALAEAAEAEAATTAAAATQRLAVAQAEATGVMGVLSRAGAGLFAMIGGWPTVALAAGVGIYYLVTAQTELEKECVKLDQVLRTLKDSQGALTPSMISSGEAAMKEAQQLAALAQRKAEQAQREADAAGASDASTTAYIYAAEAAQGYAKDAKELADRAKELGNALRFANVQAGVNGTGLADWMDGMRGALSQVEALGESLKKETDKFEEQAATYKKGHAALVEYQRDHELARLSIGLTAEQVKFLKERLDEQYAPTLKAAQALDAVTEAHKEATKAAKDAASAQKELERAQTEYARGLQQIDDLEEQLAVGLGGPYMAALKTYQRGIKDTAAFWGEAYVAGHANEDLIARLSKMQEDLEIQLGLTNAKVKDQNDLLTQAAQAIEIESRALRVLPAFQDAVRTGMEEYNRLLREHMDFAGNFILDEARLKDALDKQLPTYIASKQALHDLNEAYKLNQDAIREWQQIYQSGFGSIADAFGQFFSGQLKSWNDLGRSIVDSVRRMIGDVISEYLKLSILNPFINSLFGARTGQMLPTMGALGGVIPGGTGGFTSLANGATENSIMGGPSTWLSIGKTMWNGFAGGGMAGSSMWGTWSGQQPLFGAGVDPFSSGSYGSFNPSTLTQTLSVLGAIYAGVNRFSNRYDTGTGLAGGAAYGLGTYSLGMGAASMATGGSFIAGAGALGPVGWIAAAAMLVDMATGGGLFGTSANKFQMGQSDLSVGADGASLAIGADYKGKKPLFGGSYHEWKTIAPNQDQIDAANGLYQALLKESTQFAKQFGETVGSVASGTFREIFDKNGNVTSSSSIVNGVEYKGEKQDQFTARILAESYTETLKSVGVDITTYTKQFIKDAETYSKAVQDAGLAMQYAQQDLKKNGIDISGKGLQGAFDTSTKYLDGSDTLAQTYQRLSAEFSDVKKGIGLLTGQDTIAAIEAFIRESRNVGESLGDTYRRLQQASEQYRQFIAQFKAPATYVDDFQASLAGLHDQMLANIKQANELAKAAGLQGASTQDLLEIQKRAIEQQNALVRQLDSALQSAAFNLGLTAIGPLDQVSAELDRLKSARDAAQNVRSFGSAMQSAAKAASDAMNLLLGDLSPLNDQQKLQKALEGLREGTVSQEQVLQIGRRLYASSEAYNSLFAMVQSIGSRGVADIGGGTSPQSATPGFSAADQKRLEELQKQYDQLKAADQLKQFQSIAQQIAELSAVTGDGWEKIVKDRGIDLVALEKGLGLKSDSEFSALIEKIQKQEDSNGENTTSIVDAITGSINKLIDFLRGGNGLTPHAGTGPDLPNGRSLSDDDVRRLARGIADGIAGGNNYRPRSGRTPSYVQ